MTVDIEVQESQEVTFSGSGLTMTLRSKYFKDFTDADFTVFIYDSENNLLQQYELGSPSGDSFTFPSLYQNGFIVKRPYGQGGNLFELVYTYNGLHPLARHPPKCTL